MGITISSLLASPAFEAENTSSGAAAQAAQPTSSVPADTVQLTEAQQVSQLYNQGHSISQIAFNLNLSVQAVDSYLNISDPSGS
jgi:DNA-binding NarL/FixJ family response regulator